MKDKILAGFLRDFVEDHGLADLGEAEQFERLAAYCAMARDLQERFDPDLTSTGGGKDLGIDALAIQVNGALITNLAQVQGLVDSGSSWIVRFTFVQAKRTAAFKSADITTFLDGVAEFFSPDTEFPTNDSIEELRTVADELYKHSIKFMAEPTLELVYASTGTWQDDEHVRASVKKAVDRIKALQMFEDVRFSPMGARELRETYKELRHKVSRDIEFLDHAVLPELPSAPQSLVAVIECNEYLKLVSDAKGDLLPNLFYENVRDFQGDNTVNSGIQKTVRDASAQAWLPLMNNGVTVIARGVKQRRKKFTLHDFQVVNGCQTTHVLHRNREQLDSKTCLTMKLIESSDPVLAATQTRTSLATSAPDRHRPC